MKPLNLGICQINPKVGDFEGNLKKIISLWKSLSPKCHIVIFPELAITGYPPEDLLLRRDFIRSCHRALLELLKVSKEMQSLLVFGLPFKEKDLHNALAVIFRGELVGMYFKRFLPNYLVFDEKRYFASGKEPLLLEVNQVKIGFSICEDIWHPDGWEPIYAASGAEVIVSINASPYHRGKFEYKQSFLKARAQDNQCYLVYVNLCGAQDELVFDGRSMVINPEGKVISQLLPFKEDVDVVSLNPNEVFQKRLIEPRLREKTASIPVAKKLEVKKEVPFVIPHLRKNLEKEEEVYAAICEGLKNYVEKNGFKRVIVGLSGGIDSALTLCIAVDALGKERVVPVFMPSRFTSDQSKIDAETLCKALEVELLVYSIDEVFEVFRNTLNSEDFSIADENLQARIRANILFYLSNKLGGLVLATSNKSEVAVGYTTIYGDMSGGFAPLKDVYKTWVYRLAAYRNSISRVIPESIFKKPPSAELREGQTDQDTLPPYSILDSILELYIEKGLSPEEIVKIGFDEGVVKRVIQMVKSAEFKRKQAPPGPKITFRAFGKDWRMPITSHFPDFS